MNKENKNWEDEFDRRFAPELFDEESQKIAMTSYVPYEKMIKSFISSLLTHTRQELLDEIIEECRREEKYHWKLAELQDINSEEYSRAYRKAQHYSEAIRIIDSYLKAKKED